MTVTTRSLILSLRPLPHHKRDRLPSETWRLFLSIGIARRPTRRGRRAGKQTKRSAAAKCFASICLINARSICNKSSSVHDLLATERIDILAVTETWLSPANDVDLIDACPSGFSALHVPRPGNRRGGGVAALYRSSIQASKLTLPLVSPKTFEYIALAFIINFIPIRLIFIYRPPKLPKTLGSTAIDLFF